jgi:hypothetical protein
MNGDGGEAEIFIIEVIPSRRVHMRADGCDLIANLAPKHTVNGAHHSGYYGVIECVLARGVLKTDGGTWP